MTTNLTSSIHRTAQTQPTLEMVAAAAGVSRSTVSRVVNDSPKVTPEAAAAVKAAIEKLGYVPNRAARILASRRTYSVCRSADLWRSPTRRATPNIPASSFW